MKRLNLILATEDPASTQTDPATETIVAPGTAVTVNDGDITPEMITPEMESQLAALDTTLQMYPEMAKDPEILKLIEIKKGMERSAANQPAATATQTPEAGTTTATTAASVELDDNPFFPKENTAVDFSKATEADIKKIAAGSFGVDVTKPTWVADMFTKVTASANSSGEAAQAKAELEAIRSDIAGLPKELQASIDTFIKKGDWRTVLSAGSTMDYTKDFSELTPQEKIKAHNFYFPEDKLEDNADITDKSIAKAVKAAESSYKADKRTVELNDEKAKSDRAEANKVWNSSVSSSIEAFKTAYPTFRKSDLAVAEKIFKETGIGSVFLDKDGNALPDAFEKLVFAINGKSLLKATAAVASNKGKSEGKAEVLQTVRTDGGGTKENSKQLTDEEKRELQVLQESQNNLTY